MSEHFVKYINIERYKGFSDFSANSLKRVNLISGKNNVGKTTLMEAMLLCAKGDSAPMLLKGFWLFAYQRYKLEYVGSEIDKDSLQKNILDQAGSVSIQSNLNSVSFDYKDDGLTRQYRINTNGHVLTISQTDIDISSAIKNIQDRERSAVFIPSSGSNNNWLISSFQSIQKKDRESEVYKYLNSLDNTISNVKPFGGDSIECKVLGKDGSYIYRDINEFGSGFHQYLTIIVALFKSENSYICIDELGSGIHYSALDKLWEIILNLSKELNVQVFATTHSKECIESYCRVTEKLNDEDISFITLVKNKEKAVKAIVRDYEVFTDSIHDEREVRGW